MRCWPAGEFETIPELEFGETANLAAEAGHDQWTHLAGADAEPVPELEFDQTLGLQICAAEMANTAARGWVWCRGWHGAVRVVDYRYCSMEIVQFLLVGPVNPFLN